MPHARIDPRKAWSAALVACLVLGAGGALASPMTLSTGGAAVLGGLSFADGDLAEYEPSTGLATLFFAEAGFGSNEDIDALHLIGDGSFLFSTRGNATLGGLSFGNDDIVLYDPVSDVATLFFDGGALFASSNEDVDAVSLLSNGHLILSTSGSASLGGLDFEDGDLVAYDPIADSATLFLSESLFTNSEDIDAVHVRPNGEVLLSTSGNASLGGLSFGDDDVVAFDPVNGTATLFFDGGALFAGSEDVDALSLPEPGVSLLGACVLFGGLLPRRRRA